VGRWVFDKPVCENVAIEDCGLLALFIEIEEEAVRIVLVSVCRMSGKEGYENGERGRKQLEAVLYERKPSLVFSR